MTEWLISCDPRAYNLDGAFEKLEAIDWKQSTNIEVGDIVYIYVTAPVYEIRYKCIATKVNLDAPDIDDDGEFNLEDESYQSYGRYMELTLMERYQSDKLRLQRLKDNGLGTVQGPSRITPQLSAYLFASTNTLTGEGMKRYEGAEKIFEPDPEVIAAEEEEEARLLQSLKQDPFTGTEDDFAYQGKPRKKRAGYYNGRIVYPRDRQTAVNALAHVHYLCEIDEAHETFIRKNSDKPYTEPHHLIPMAYSDEFSVSLDVEENIVSLCSNCHNLIHYGEDARILLEQLYEERKEALERAGISITLERLLSMYGIEA